MADGFVANDEYFDTILRSPGVEALVDASAEGALAEAVANAPVDTGAYKRGLHIEHVEARYRRVARIVGSDEKTMLIESKTGNLARSLKGAKR